MQQIKRDSILFRQFQLNTKKVLTTNSDENQTESKPAIIMPTLTFDIDASTIISGYNKILIKPVNTNNSTTQAKDVAVTKDNTDKGRAVADLESTLKNWLSEINDETNLSKSDKHSEENKTILTKSEFLSNFDEMLNSSNAEISGIAKVIKEFFAQFGIETIDIYSTILDSFNGVSAKASDSQITMLILNKMFDLLSGADINSESSQTKYSALTEALRGMTADKQSGLTLEQLLALDTNGDGSIVDELKEKLSNPELVSMLNKDIEKAHNKANVNYQIMLLATKDENSYEISTGEIAQAFGNNEVADLFKMKDGRVDRALILALGGKESKDGNYTISASLLNDNLYKADYNNDGKITKEEIEQFKQTQEYKKAEYDVMMAAVDTNYYQIKDDKKINLNTINQFVNNTEVPEGQKELFKMITNISDNNLKKYIMKAISNGSETVSIEQFTKTIDCNGDGIVTKDEMKKFIDFVTQFYNADKNNDSDRRLNRQQASKIEPFKSNPDLWYSFPKSKNCINLSDVWNYVKSH